MVNPSYVVITTYAISALTLVASNAQNSSPSLKMRKGLGFVLNPTHFQSVQQDAMTSLKPNFVETCSKSVRSVGKARLHASKSGTQSLIVMQDKLEVQGGLADSAARRYWKGMNGRKLSRLLNETKLELFL
jgi:hypothetical protein